MDKYYPLPQLTSQKSVVATNASSVIHEFGSNFNPLTFHSNTKQIFNSIYGDGKKLFESCNASNIDGGQFNLIIFNNINQDFTIDFSENNSSSSPPSFCGLIAARNIKIILNDEEKGPHREHLFIGKLLVKGSIHISRNGNLRIHDIATVNSDSIKDIRPEISLENLKFQFYNQKYFSAQNFTVPFFKDNSIYNSTAVQHMGYVPRSTRSFFNQVCDMPAPNPHFRCRQKEITSPDMKTLTRDLGKKLIYDISILE